MLFTYFSYLCQSRPRLPESGYRSAVTLMQPQWPSCSTLKPRDSCKLKAASVTAAKRKEVFLKEKWGEDPGSRAKMALWD